jgi:hypothetical protein
VNTYGRLRRPPRPDGIFEVAIWGWVKIFC